MTAVDYEANPKVRSNVAEVKEHRGSPKALAAYKSINRRLAQDNAVGSLSEVSTEVLRFPGREEPEPREYGPILQRGGRTDTVPVHIQDHEVVYPCHAKRDLARELTRHLLREETVRVHGMGSWKRTEDGEWHLSRFNINHFERLDDKPLPDVVDELQGIHSRSEWAEMSDARKELESLRRGD